jgi:hypothetical protein
MVRLVILQGNGLSTFGLDDGDRQLKTVFPIHCHIDTYGQPERVRQGDLCILLLI